MGVRVTHTIHYVEVARLQSTSGGAYRDVLRRGVLVMNGAKRRVRVDTGRLRSSIHMTTDVRVGDSVGVRVGSNVEYAPFVGTDACKSCWGDYLRDALNDIRS